MEGGPYWKEGAKSNHYGTLIVCNGSFLLQASKTGSIVVALILLSEIISHMLNKIYLTFMLCILWFNFILKGLNFGLTAEYPAT